VVGRVRYNWSSVIEPWKMLPKKNTIILLDHKSII
jgi:hypothetical protein